jgi:hypothetical protein
MITDKPENKNSKSWDYMTSDGELVPFHMPSDYVKSSVSQLLGNTTRFASRPLKDSENSDSTSKKYHLQHVSAGLLKTERVSRCMKAIAPNKINVQVVRHPDGGGGFKNLMRCGSVWTCPVCASIITEKRRDELMHAIANWSGSVVMITYTISHQKFHDLENVFTIIRDARRFFKSGREFQAIKKMYGWAGSVASIEVTHGSNGWHPHVHELVFISKEAGRDHKFLENALKTRWTHSVAKFGGYANKENGLDLTTANSEIYDYIAKFGRLPVNVDHEDKQTWRLDQEIAKSAVKKGKMNGRTPMQLLEDFDGGDSGAGRLFQEYARVFKGKKQLYWSRGLRDLLGLNDEVEDEEIAENADNEIKGETVAIINLVQWRVIVKNHWRGHVLKLVRAGEIVKLRQWLDRLE